ncbi:DUF3103 family protein [Pseudopedobacter sp.]|uniref:DUF3103 family protein n=1 Tax=Pseudopedobacter sp. TaxID=1936787 RepID=UPI00333FF0C1
MKKFSKVSLLFFIVSFVNISCKEESFNQPNSTSAIVVPVDSRVVELSDSRNHKSLDNEYSVSNEREDVLMEKFAISLARSLSNGNFRDFIKSEANKQFDGDYDILVLNQLTTTIGGKELQNILVGSDLMSEGELSELTKIKKDLNISIPLNIDKWETQNQAPVVTYIPTYYKENKTEAVLGFDYTGKKYSVDAINEPEVPVIVIGRNERVDENNNVRKAFLEPSNNDSNIYKIKNSISAKILACTGPYRINGYWERLHQINMKVSAFESWLAGKAEVRLACFAPNLTTPTAFANLLFTPSDINIYRDQSEEWIDRPMPLFFWDNTVVSQSIMYFFYESDGGPSTQEHTFSNSYKLADNTTTTSTVKYTIQRDDQVIGKMVIPQFPCPPNVINGDFYHYVIGPDFRFSQKNF